MASSFTEAAIANLSKSADSKSLLNAPTPSPVDFSRIQMEQTMGDKSFADFPAPNTSAVPAQVREGLGRIALYDTQGNIVPKKISQPFLPNTELRRGKPTAAQQVVAALPTGVQRLAETFLSSAKEGPIAFLLPTLARDTNEKVRVASGRLEDMGVAPDRAAELAFYSVFSKNTYAPGTVEYKAAEEAGRRLAALQPTEAEARSLGWTAFKQGIGEGIDIAGTIGPENVAKNALARAIQVAQSGERAGVVPTIAKLLQRAGVDADLAAQYAPRLAASDFTRIEEGLLSLERLQNTTKRSGTLFADAERTPKTPRGTQSIPQLERMLERERESLAAAEANPEAHAKAYGGDQRAAYKEKITELRARLAEARSAARDTEIDSLEDLATQHAGSDYVQQKSVRESIRVTSNLESLFAEMKGVDASNIGRFTDKELQEAKANYKIITDALIDHPGRALTKYRLPGQAFGDVSLAEHQARGSAYLKRLEQQDQERLLLEKQRNTGLAAAAELDQRITELGYANLDEAQKGLESYLKLRESAAKALADVRAIERDIRLAKQRDKFVGAERTRLTMEAARNLEALRAIARTAEQIGYKKGLSAGSKRYNALVTRLKDRRSKLNAIKRTYNLTDAQMQKVRGPEDPRFMDAKQFDQYLEEVRGRAEHEAKRDIEKSFIDDIIQSNDLKKTENLQRAMELPPIKDMSLDELIEFGNVLEKTKPESTFLSPRMIQTVRNTDLGDIKTIEEGRDAILKQTGMPYGEGVKGRKLDRWLRDPTLVERDPIHKIYITEWAAHEADMLTRKAALSKKLNELAKAARRARRSQGPKRSLRRRVFDVLQPWDDHVVRWLQPFETTYFEDANGNLRKVVTYRPELRERVQAIMTPEEIKYARFLQDFFTHYYNISANEATARWTLLGVKRSNYRRLYLPHIQRGMLEKWRDEGFLSALRHIWAKDVVEAKIDYNAFGDRGEVLGMEKWLNRSMTREGEGVSREPSKADKLAPVLFYSQNTAKVALSYFHAFERKLIVDKMTPKIKILEFLMGKRFETPKSISNPEGAEKVHSQLTRHINEWINNKKGQRIEIIYEQGDRAEQIVDTARLFVAVQHLGANIFAQTISGIGGEVLTYSGLGIKGWAKGHARALTMQGRKIAHDYAGIIGESPWFELASAAHNAGDTARSGLFYIFGDLAYRARRQMLLGSLTPEEFKTGIITPKRQAQVKLNVGKWHALPEHRSIAGSTSFVKTAGMYSEWAIPAFQNTYFNLIPRLRSMVRSTDPDKWKAVAKSDEFRTLLRMVVAGAGLGAAGYLLLDPDQNDQSLAGYIRRKAAQEIASTIQAITLFGIPTPFSIMSGYVDSLRTAVGLLLTGAKYESTGPGHKEGDLKAPDAFYRALVPRAIKQLTPEPETPIKTADEIRDEIRQKLESGEIDESAAIAIARKEIESLKKAQAKRDLALPEKEFKAAIRARIESGEISLGEAKKEIADYLEEKKKYAPESFESKSDAGFIEKIKIAAKAIGTDPVTLFEAIFTGEEIRRMDNGEIILYRGKTSNPAGQKEFAVTVRKARGATEGLMLDHTIPLQLGGDNSDGNLKLVPRKEWERYTPVENYLGVALRNGDIDGKKAQELIRSFKAGEVDEAAVYAAVEGP